MGQKSTKHKETDGDTSPSPRKSPKHSSPTKPSGRERTPPRKEQGITDKGGGYSEETPIEPATKSVSYSTPSSKSYSEPVGKENVYSGKSDKSRTPSKMSGKDPVEPLTPIIVNTELVNHHMNTSTPAQNGVISSGQSPPMSPISDEEQSDDEAFTPDGQFNGRSASPSTVSLASQSTVSSAARRSQSKASLNPKFEQKSPHFHRPANFSYSRETPEFLKSKKSGMAQLADLKNEEAIRMSMFPGGKPSKPNEVPKIEREDWPGPPSLAAILPDIMRERRKSRGETDDDEDEGPEEDPQVAKEIEEISKFKDTSGIGSVIYKELAERKVRPHKPLDPWKASRVPSADHEPRYHTRYQSPMFASPSRFVDRPRRAWDDSDIRRVPKPGYGSYGLVAKAATLPVSGVFGGPLDFLTRAVKGLVMKVVCQMRLKKKEDTSTSTVNTEKSYGHQSSIHDGPGVSLLTFQRSTWHTEVEPEIYPYERLKITNFDLPRDVDRNLLEIHLSNDEFYSIFKMNREEFHRLAEWKQNDLKRKVDLF
ncbi:hypothetical protein KUTeg_005194 [Tegillarca granosa]|uniref:HP domain-containing protein n=1 Tax=Tegillarca granosa TaxID=220873 RepID=A0ABQ9FLY2_TEGGR|nr:hypothetical protein KUTeg_005194 [Tegillarca granosa]